MELEQARKRAEELRVVIERNNRLYYDQDAPELEDFEYDALTRELKALEAEFPQLVTANSPTQKVGGTPSALCQGDACCEDGKPSGCVFLRRTA